MLDTREETLEMREEKDEIREERLLMRDEAEETADVPIRATKYPAQLFVSSDSGMDPHTSVHARIIWFPTGKAPPSTMPNAAKERVSSCP